MKTRRPGAGRKNLPPGTALNVTVGVVVDSQTHKKLKKLAIADDRTVSYVVRKMVEKALEKKR